MKRHVLIASMRLFTLAYIAVLFYNML